MDQSCRPSYLVAEVHQDQTEETSQEVAYLEGHPACCFQSWDHYGKTPYFSTMHHEMGWRPKEAHDDFAVEPYFLQLLV